MKKKIMFFLVCFLIFFICGCFVVGNIICNEFLENKNFRDVSASNAKGNQFEEHFVIESKIVNDLSCNESFEDISTSNEKNTSFKEHYNNENGFGVIVCIDEIHSGEAIPVARVFISEGIIYEIEVTTDCGSTIFTGLRMTIYEREMSGLWFNFLGRDQMPHNNEISAWNLVEGFYYIYVGNQGSDLIVNANIKIISSNSRAIIDCSLAY